jgi:hypothetical protein
MHMQLTKTDDAMSCSPKQILKESLIQGSKPVCPAHTDRAEADEREEGREYKSITTSATAARHLWHLHLLLSHSTISQKYRINPSPSNSVPSNMSSSAVSKKPTQDAAPTRSGMVDSREETTKASASV